MVYSECVACSGSLKGSGLVRVCSRCGGVHVQATSLAQALSVVDFRTLAKQAPEERYFDVTYVEGGETHRVHGWYDPTTRKMTQIG